jgi:hypothetical protein
MAGGTAAGTAVGMAVVLMSFRNRRSRKEFSNLFQIFWPFFEKTPFFVIPPPDTGLMSNAQLTIVNLEPANLEVVNAEVVNIDGTSRTLGSRYQLDDRTRQLGQAGLASARAILAEAAARREAAVANHAQAA